MPKHIASNSPVLIIGAGIAGLTLAQGLHLHSIPFRLFERTAQSHRSQGHRFRISKEGQSALHSVLSPRLQNVLTTTAPLRNQFQPRYVDAGELNFSKPVPAGLESMPTDRTWIRKVLMLGIEDAIEYEKELVSYKISDEGVQVQFTDGTTAAGRLLVGADGVKSKVRKQLQPDRKLLNLERWVIWGRSPLTLDVRASMRPDLLTWCMYLDYDSNVQAVVEPMIWPQNTQQSCHTKLTNFSDYIYWVICTASKQYSDVIPKTSAEKKLLLDRVTEKWHPDLRALFVAATLDQCASAPVLSSKPDIEVSSTDGEGKVTLIGDAAHAMSPMGGSGADTAIRNAAQLANVIAEGFSMESMQSFEEMMEDLAREKIEHSFLGGQKFWRGKGWTEYDEVET